MSFTDILPIILIVIFWMALFVFAFWFSRVALHAPTEGEIEALSAQIERSPTTSAQTTSAH
ncbi:MAG TPA: hypothetical protein VE338_18065 [Ktedonobacterales bacterium]|jgi:phosphotransferase system  glucose/maltose/N-acetylglucosamine-specific IIC component|nr:hypothetical protein [Ktedonobacterales bacterium]